MLMENRILDLEDNVNSLQCRVNEIIGLNNNLNDLEGRVNKLEELEMELRIAKSEIETLKKKINDMDRNIINNNNLINMMERKNESKSNKLSSWILGSQVLLLGGLNLGIVYNLYILGNSILYL